MRDSGERIRRAIKGSFQCNQQEMSCNFPIIYLSFFFLSVFIRVNPWLQGLSLSLMPLWQFPYAPRRERIASAASLARSPRSPTGPTQDGQPFSHGHAAMSSRVLASSRLCAR
jgi:hypothetical protein